MAIRGVGDSRGRPWRFLYLVWPTLEAVAVVVSDAARRPVKPPRDEADAREQAA